MCCTHCLVRFKCGFRAPFYQTAPIVLRIVISPYLRAVQMLLSSASLSDCDRWTQSWQPAQKYGFEIVTMRPLNPKLTTRAKVWVRNRNGCDRWTQSWQPAQKYGFEIVTIATVERKVDNPHKSMGSRKRTGSSSKPAFMANEKLASNSQFKTNALAVKRPHFASYKVRDFHLVW